MSNQEKTAWLTLSLCVIALCGFVTLFLLLHDKLGASRAMMVAMSPVGLIAFAAFGPLIFNRSRYGDMVMVTDNGTMIRYPYRRYLTIGMIAGGIMGAAVLILLMLDIPRPVAQALPLLFVIGVGIMVVALGILYKMKQRATELNTDNMNASDLYIYGPDLDERDLSIKQTARWSGFGAFWIVYVFGLLGIWGWFRFHGQEQITITIDLLPQFLWLAFILIMLVDALVTIIMYRRGGMQ